MKTLAPIKWYWMPNWCYLLLLHFPPCSSGFEVSSVSYKSWLWLPFPEQKVGRGQGCSTAGCESCVQYTGQWTQRGEAWGTVPLCKLCCGDDASSLRNKAKNWGQSLFKPPGKGIASPSIRGLAILLVDLLLIWQYDGLSWRHNKYIKPP